MSGDGWGKSEAVGRGKGGTIRPPQHRATHLLVDDGLGLIPDGNLQPIIVLVVGHPQQRHERICLLTRQERTARRIQQGIVDEAAERAAQRSLDHILLHALLQKDLRQEKGWGGEWVDGVVSGVAARQRGTEAAPGYAPSCSPATGGRRGAPPAPWQRGLAGSG